MHPTPSPFSSVVSVDAAPWSATDMTACHTTAPTWSEGVKSSKRPASAGADSWVLLAILVMTLAAAFNMRNVSRLLKTVYSDLFSVRSRENAFDEHTANEARTLALLIVMLCVMEALLLFQGLAGVDIGVGLPVAFTQAGISRAIVLLTVVAGCLYIFQLISCMLVGYTFADAEGARIWRRGLNASQILLCFALSVPAVLSLFYPQTARIMLFAGIGLYIASRICFIAKGFRIFYTNLGSLLYFILYLCTLEIIPVLTAGSLACEICMTR